MTIAPANPGDCDEVIDLWKAAGLVRPWNDPIADFRLAQSGPASCILLARNGSALLASVMTGLDGHRGWVYYLAVAADAQRQGIGRQMMAAAEHWLRDHGAPKIQLMVRSENGAVKDFYAAIGYETQDVITIGKRLD